MRANQIQSALAQAVVSWAGEELAEIMDGHLSSFTKDIAEFHVKYGLEYGDEPRDLPHELEVFRIKFMAEELGEYVKAHHADADTDEEKRKRRADKLDALVDLVYVALGTAYLHGFDFDEAWRRVHEANMKKVRVERAEDSKRGSTFDVVKPAGWEPPNLEDLV